VLTRRRQKVLMALVDEYVESAAPVASSRIARRYLKEVSPATVRNELMGLETDGYALSPHTSAGRVPTNTGYQVFVDSLFLSGDIALRDITLDSLNALEPEQRLERLLAYVSENTGLLAMFWSLRPESTMMHRGLPQLMAQPEFREAAALIPLMRLLEDESAMARLLLSAAQDKGLIVRIGIMDDGDRLASYSLIAEIIGRPQPQAVFAVFGPTRMDYRNAIPTVLLAAKLLERLRLQTRIW
jgi:transcriptional regulator of heat shock response